jgi:hypothetical protein
MTLKILPEFLGPELVRPFPNSLAGGINRPLPAIVVVNWRVGQFEEVTLTSQQVGESEVSPISVPRESNLISSIVGSYYLLNFPESNFCSHLRIPPAPVEREYNQLRVRRQLDRR